MDEYNISPELIYLPHCVQSQGNDPSFLGNSAVGLDNISPVRGLQNLDRYQTAAGHAVIGVSSSYYSYNSTDVFSGDHRHPDHIPSTDIYPLQTNNNGTDVTEIRREKSRDAARSRRGKENYEFLSLSRLLPLPSAITGQLDKASVIRLCISTLKLRKFARQGDPSWPAAPLKLTSNEKRLAISTHGSSKEAVDTNFGSNVLQAHDGFVVALSAEGIILYISETVSVYLGLSQVELTGSSLFEYIHEEDRMELADALNIPWDPAVIFQDIEPPLRMPSQEPSSDSEDGVLFGPVSPRPDQHFVTGSKERPVMIMPGWKSCFHKIKTNYCVRFRSTLTKRGVQMKYSGYRVLSLQWGSRLGSSLASSSSENGHNGAAGQENPNEFFNYGYTMCATALPSLNMNELRVDKSSFTMKLTLDFRIMLCDPRIQDLLEYSPDLITDTSFYTLTYGSDYDLVCELHRDVLRKGQTLSSYYRIMKCRGGYLWMQTCAHLMAASKTPNDQCIVAVHTVISNVQYENEIFGASPVVTARCKLAPTNTVKEEKKRLPSDPAGGQSLIRHSASAGVSDIPSEKKRKLAREEASSLDQARNKLILQPASTDPKCDTKPATSSKPRKTSKNEPSDGSNCKLTSRNTMNKK